MNKILIFFPSWGLGGSTLYLGQFVSHFVEKNYLVYCVCRKPDNGTIYLQKLGAHVKYTYTPMSLSLTAESKHNVLSFINIIKDIYKFFVGFIISLFYIIRIKPNFIFVGEFTLIQTMLVCNFLKVKYSAFIQTTITKRKFKKKIVTFFLSKADKVIAITGKHLESFFIQNGYVVHNFSSINDKTTKFKNEEFELFIKGKKVITFIGGLSKIKGVLDFLKISKEVSSNKEFVFLIIGPFNSSKQKNNFFSFSINKYSFSDIVLQYILKEKLTDRIYFTGETNHVEYYLRFSRIFVSVNEYPHFSRPILEAWKNNIPVVAVKDAYTEYMDDNSGSIVFIDDRLDYKKTAELIFNVAYNEELRDLIIKNGYSNFFNRFSSEVFLSRITYIFNDEDCSYW